MKKQFNKEVRTGLKRISGKENELITEKDLQHLPKIVQKYLHYTGVVGKEKVRNMRVILEGRMRGGPDEDWMKIQAEQYSFFDEPTRVFFIKANKAGLPVRGIHLYKDEKAIMVIKLLGLFKVVDARGPVMDQSETVTMFNDMCMMAPATLIDKRIKWEEVDLLNVKAKYTNGGQTISAKITFNEKGRLVDFISGDRFELRGKDFVQLPWSTPVHDYAEINGMMLPKHADAVYHRQEGAYSYAEFVIRDVDYNVEE
ncbi:MAG: hypothetical protein K9G67_02375 [Bacteroidales bacterium]|nr:hypothetical protein [Bacteroidales bacterium]MCF8343642.1 hypothetical protein [Bacteroidales bacterium]MCF8352262.1 hypothetical protein [Bacteroidales bacterium]MCF8375178.1 hypothetical protein [Bacteroidales bacterium]MCF8400700.1 hypothetical protein [Bacteroidales bacterium]